MNLFAAFSSQLDNPHSMAKKTPEEIAMEIQRINLDFRLARIKILAFTIAASFCVTIVCLTALVWKWLDDPAWVKIISIILGPSGIVAISMFFSIIKREITTRSMRNRIKSTKWLENGEQE